MRLLLDTHLLIWAAGSDPNLPRTARLLVSDPRNELVFSAASIWEVAIKAQRTKSGFGLDSGVLRRALLESGYAELAVTGDHAAAITALPRIHRDPFDRLLLAQAVVEGMTLVTSDATLASYPGPVRKI